MVLGVGLGALLAVGIDAFGANSRMATALAMVSAALIGGAANAINDVYDLAIDRVNRPDRPLPSGAVSVQAARALWGGVSGIGILLGVSISMLHGVIAASSVALLWAYSAHLKRLPGWGNLAVAAILVLAVLYGALAVQPGVPVAVLVGCAFAGLTTLAREAAKDIEDMEGDQVEGARTLPLVWGRSRTASVVLGLIGLTLLAFPVAVLSGVRPAFLGYGLPAAGALLIAAWAMLSAGAYGDEPTWKQNAHRASLWLKTAMALGIVALALARLG